MANEVSIQGNLTASKGGINVNFTGAKTLDMTGEDMIQATQAVGTSAEQIGLGAITGAPGYVLIKNTDDTNFVELANDASMLEKFAKLLPGQVALFPPASGTIYGKADTAECTVVVVAVEA